MIDKAAIQRAHPEWNIVDAIEAPGGGIWALGRDGGVFSLNAAGGTDGAVAPYLGSYTGLAEKDRQGDRYFTGIRIDATTGGYTLISNRSETYNFVGNRNIDQTPTAPVAAPVAAPNFTDADYNQLLAGLKGLGLEGLIDDAWRYYKDPQGAAGDANAVLAYLPTTQTYKDRFPGLDELSKQGRAWTPAQWNDYYNTAQEQALSAGLPPGYLDRADVGKLIAGGVSPGELQGRIQAAGAAVYKADPMLIDKMREYGLSDGDLTAFFLDPDKATPLIERKAQMQRAGIGAAAQKAGFGIDYGRASGLQAIGVDESQAAQGFGQIANQHALFTNLVNEEGEITFDEQIGATFDNDVAAQQEIERRRTGRTAMFQGGGGAASGGGGKTGLGSS